jgi:hypothetical protein
MLAYTSKLQVFIPDDNMIEEVYPVKRQAVNSRKEIPSQTGVETPSVT